MGRAGLAKTWQVREFERGSTRARPRLGDSHVSSWLDGLLAVESGVCEPEAIACFTIAFLATVCRDPAQGANTTTPMLAHTTRNMPANCIAVIG